MQSLIVGGTSGLGLEIARGMAAQGNEVIVTGRHDPEVDFATYERFDLMAPGLPKKIGQFIVGLPDIDTLVYAAGFYQGGHVNDLSDEQVDAMFDIGARGLVFFVKKLLEKQGTLKELIVITSTSEVTAREIEPVYNFVKAGGGLYTKAQSLDPAVGRTMKVLVSGMKTPFWDGQEKDTSEMLDASWVAEQIIHNRSQAYKYMPLNILGPLKDKRVEIGADFLEPDVDQKG